jgi:hypothetical protein
MYMYMYNIIATSHFQFDKEYIGEWGRRERGGCIFVKNSMTVHNTVPDPAGTALQCP